MNKSIKILGLHGKGGSGAQFKSLLEPLIHSTRESNVNWLFPDAPYDHKTEKREGYQWWTLPPNVRSFDADIYGGVDKSLLILKEEFPVDVIIGHSQGAMLATILIANNFVHYPKAAIISGVAWPKPYSNVLSALSENKKINDLKSLFVIGENDQVNPPRDAHKICRIFKGEELTHKYGHTLPMTDYYVEKYKKFLLRIL